MRIYVITALDVEGETLLIYTTRAKSGNHALLKVAMEHYIEDDLLKRLREVHDVEPSVDNIKEIIADELGWYISAFEYRDPYNVPELDIVELQECP